MATIAAKDISSKPKKNSLESKQRKFGYIFTLPFVIGCILFVGYPLVLSILYSFSDVVFLKGKDNLCEQPAGNSVIARQEGIFLKETLATAATITALTQMQEGISCHWYILDNLHPIVVYTVCYRPTTGTDMLSAG